MKFHKYLIFVLYFLISIVSANTVAAVNGMPLADNAEDSHELFLEGQRYLNSYDEEKAFSFFKRAADAGNPLAKVALVRHYYWGFGVKKDLKIAERYGREAFSAIQNIATSGNATAQFYLGYLYGKGFGAQQDYKKALKWYKKAAVKGHKQSNFRIGVIYYFAMGVPRDYSRARTWFNKAASLGNRAAMHNLGVIYRDGKGVERDYNKAISWFEKAAMEGNAGAMNRLGLLYRDGKGVARDYNKAISWFKKAAKKGNGYAMSYIGEMYEKGQGVTKNINAAVTWFQKGAEKGIEYSMFSLGWAYEKGEGIGRDKKQAMKWYKKAAEKGHVESMNRLGRLYYRQSYGTNKAKKYFRMAADKGHKKAKKSLKYIVATEERIQKELEDHARVRERTQRERAAKQEKYRQLLGSFEFPNDNCSSPEHLSVNSQWQVDQFNSEWNEWLSCLTKVGNNDRAAMRSLVLNLGGTWEWTKHDQTQWKWSVPTDCNCREKIKQIFNFENNRIDARNSLRHEMDEIIANHNRKMDNHNRKAKTENFYNNMNSIIQQSNQNLRDAQRQWNSSPPLRPLLRGVK